MHSHNVPNAESTYNNSGVSAVPVFSRNISELLQISAKYAIIIGGYWWLQYSFSKCLHGKFERSRKTKVINHGLESSPRG